MVWKIQIYNLKKNIIPILIAFVIGIAFWFYAKTDTIVTNKIKYPVGIKTHKNLIMTESFPDSITLSITGKIRLLRLLMRISPIIKITKNNPGFQTIHLKKENLRFPAYLRVKNFEIIEPDSIIIHIDSIVEKEVTIILSKGISSIPDKVIIRGPKSIIRDINYLSPDSIPVGDITTITLGTKLIKVVPDKIKIEK